MNTRTTNRRVIEAFNISGRRRPCNRVALIIAAVLHDIVNGHSENHHLGADAQCLARQVRDRIIKARERGRDVTNIRLT